MTTPEQTALVQQQQQQAAAAAAQQVAVAAPITADSIAGLLAQQLGQLSPEMMAAHGQEREQLEAGGMSFPRVTMRQHELEMKGTDNDRILGQEFEAICLGVSVHEGREFNPSEYDPKNPIVTPPVCVSLDGKTPAQQFAGTPLVVDGLRKSQSCAECPVGTKQLEGLSCNYVVNSVWVDVNNLTQGGMFGIKVTNSSLFHNAKKPLRGNNPALEFGLKGYMGQLAQLSQGSVPFQTYFAQTKIKVYPQMETAFAMAFSLAVDPITQQLKLNSPDVWNTCKALIDLPYYKELMESRWMPEDNTSTAPAQVAPAQVTPVAPAPVAPVPAPPVPQVNAAPATSQIVTYIKAAGVISPEWTAYFDQNAAWIDANPDAAKAQVDGAYPGLWDDAVSRLSGMEVPVVIPDPAAEAAAAAAIQQQEANAAALAQAAQTMQAANAAPTGNVAQPATATTAPATSASVATAGVTTSAVAPVAADPLANVPVEVAPAGNAATAATAEPTTPVSTPAGAATPASTATAAAPAAEVAPPEATVATPQTAASTAQDADYDALEAELDALNNLK